MKFVFSIVLALLVSVTLHAQSSHRTKASQVPDFLQTDREAGFARSGSQFCAPTAVSNSLMWLADHGYEDLRAAGNAKQAQIAMIKTRWQSDPRRSAFSTE